MSSRGRERKVVFKREKVQSNVKVDLSDSIFFMFLLLSAQLIKSLKLEIIILNLV